MSDHDKWYQSHSFLGMASTDLVNPWYYPSPPYPFHNPNFLHPFQPPECSPPPTPPYAFHPPQPPPYYAPPPTPPYAYHPPQSPPHYTPLSCHSYNCQPNSSCFMSPLDTAAQFQPGAAFAQQPEIYAHQVFDESPVTLMSMSMSDATRNQLLDNCSKMIKTLETMDEICKGICSKSVSQSLPMSTRISAVDNSFKRNENVGDVSVSILGETVAFKGSGDTSDRDEGFCLFKEAEESVKEAESDEGEENWSTAEGYEPWDGDSEMEEDGVATKKGEVDDVENNDSDDDMCLFGYALKMFDESSEPQYDELTSHIIDGSPERVLELGTHEFDVSVETKYDENQKFDEFEGNAVGLFVSAEEIVDNFGKDESNKTWNYDIMLKDNEEWRSFKSDFFLGLSSFDVDRALDESGGRIGKVLEVSSLKEGVEEGDMKKSEEENASGEGENVWDQSWPTTRAIIYRLDKKFSEVDNKNVFIYDPSGGAFDIYSLAIEETISGVINIGIRMTNHFLQERKRKNKKDATENVSALRRVRTSALRRVRTSEWKKCLKNTKLDKNYVHNVIQNGDFTMIPKVPQLLHEFLNGTKLFKSINFDETVVYDALAPATVLRGKGEEKMQELLLWDLTTLSLNVETAGGVMIVLTLRNATISTTKEHVVLTYSNNYPGVSIQEFEGEITITENGHLLSKSKLSNILPAPRDMTRISVCFVVVKIESMVSSGVSEKKLNEAECYKSEFSGMLKQLIFPGFCSPLVYVIWVAGMHIHIYFVVVSKFWLTLQILVSRLRDMELLVHFDSIFATRIFGEGNIDSNEIQLILWSLLDRDLGFSLRASVPNFGEVMTSFVLKACQNSAAMFQRCMDTTGSGDEVRYPELMAAGYRRKLMVQMMLGASYLSAQWDNTMQLKYPGLEPVMDDLLPKKSPLIVVKCQNHLNLVVVNNVPLFFNVRDGPYMPTLRLLHQYPDIMKKLQVDRGAIRFVLAGANIMCPGLTSPGGYLDEEVGAETPVAIMAEGKQHALAIGFTKMSAKDIKAINKGIGVDNMHYLNDGLWKMEKLD